jgi:signal transduction histidine kinase
MASRIALTIEREKGVLLLTAKDDGVGFDPSHNAGTGQGIRNMRERAQRIQGLLSIESAPGLGTRVTVEVPLETAV